MKHEGAYSPAGSFTRPQTGASGGFTSPRMNGSTGGLVGGGSFSSGGGLSPRMNANTGGLVGGGSFNSSSGGGGGGGGGGASSPTLTTTESPTGKTDANDGAGAGARAGARAGAVEANEPAAPRPRPGIITSPDALSPGGRRHHNTRPHGHGHGHDPNAPHIPSTRVPRGMMGRSEYTVAGKRLMEDMVLSPTKVGWCKLISG